MNLRHAFIAQDTTLFRILDGIADATNILLLVWLLVALVMAMRQGSGGARAWLASALSIAVVYIVKAIDGKLDLWERLGADYSTHSALAAALVVSLCFLDRTRRKLTLGILAVYELLIVLLGFHSILDIVTTLIIVIPLMLLCWKLLSPIKMREATPPAPV